MNVEDSRDALAPMFWKYKKERSPELSEEVESGWSEVIVRSSVPFRRIHQGKLDVEPTEGDDL